MYELSMHHLPTLTQEEQHALLVEHTTALLALLDTDGAILHVNAASHPMLGYEPAELGGDLVHDLLHPDDLPDLRTWWQDVLAGNSASQRHRVRHHDGAWRWLETHATLADHNGQHYVIVVGHDITEHKQAETAWQHNDALFRVMVDSVNDYAIFATDTGGHVATWNPGAERLFGYGEDEIIGQDVAIIFTPEDRAAGADRQELHSAATTGRAHDERWHLRKDGSRFWASGMVSPLRNENGQVYGFVKVARDYTAQKQAEAAQVHFRALFESAPGAYLVLTPNEYRIVAVSDAYLAATMTERAEIMGKVVFEVFPDDPGALNADGMRNLRASLDRVKVEQRADVMAVQHYPIRRPAALGGGWEERWWSPINSPVFGPHGELAYLIHRVEDVTLFIRQMQQQGMEAEGVQLLESRAQHMEAEVLLRAQELQQVNDQLRAAQDSLTIALDAAQLGTWDLDLRTNTARRNQRHAQIFGYAAIPPEWNQTILRQHVVEEDHPLFDDAFAHAWETGTLHLDVRVRWPDGSVHWVTAQGRVYYDAAGVPVRMAGVVMDNTERKHAEAALQASEERFRVLVTASSDTLYRMSADWREMRNLEGKNFLASTEQPSGTWLEGYIPQADRPQVQAAIAEAIRSKGTFELEHRVVRVDGSIGWTFSRAIPVLDAHQNILEWFGAASDITARKQAEAQVRASEERYRTLFTSIDEGFCLVEVLFDEHNTAIDYRFLEVNPAFERHSGIKNALGKRMREIAPNHEAYWFEAYGHVALTGEPHRFENRSDALGRWFDVSAFRVGEPERRHVVVLFKDVTERKHVEDKLQYQAAHDALTGLPNRATLLEHVRRALARHERHADQCFAVLFLDLDRFKVINDSLGHVVGDQLLIETARRLGQCVRPDDIVARLGGDEFVVLLNNIGGARDAVQIANRIHAAIATPIVLDGHTITTTTSVGITLSDQAYTQPEDMLRDADAAMYWAKRQGAGRAAVFDRNMHAAAMERLWLETELQHAIEREQLRVVYQPLVDLKTGRVHGAEALLRWQHGQRGMISPDEFIPVAEETGLIHSIGRWVLREACQQMRHWHEQSPELAPWTISVNLSGVQCRHPDLAAQVEEVLHETGLAPQYLQLEITESVLLGQTDTAIALFRDLQAMGVRLTLDDFGTGYSSLSYLHRFPVSTLKIDRSFVSTLDGDDEHGELVHTIATLARKLRMAVVAEGVETATQRDRVAAMGCDYAQGFFFAQPLEPAALAGLLQDEARAVGV